MIEILTDNNIINAFKDLKIKAVNTYKGKKYEVWELSEKDFEFLCNIPEKDWKDSWGWWRYSEGSNIEDCPVSEIFINNKIMDAYYDYDRIECETTEEILDKLLSPKCTSLTEYFITMFSCSQEGNICALATSFARLNNMKMSELFCKYEG